MNLVQGLGKDCIQLLLYSNHQSNSLTANPFLSQPEKTAETPDYSLHLEAHPRLILYTIQSKNIPPSFSLDEHLFSLLLGCTSKAFLKAAMLILTSLPPHSPQSGVPVHLCRHGNMLNWCRLKIIGQNKQTKRARGAAQREAFVVETRRDAKANAAVEGNVDKTQPLAYSELIFSLHRSAYQRLGGKVDCTIS